MMAGGNIIIATQHSRAKKNHDKQTQYHGKAKAHGEWQTNPILF